MLASAVLNIFFSGFMSQIFEVMSSLQLVLHLPIFNIIVPSNVSQIYSILIPIFMYDVLAEYLSPYLEKIWPRQDPESFKSTRALDQMADLGYDSYNPVINLGTLSFLIFGYLLRVVFVLMVLYPLACIVVRIRKFFGRQWN